VAIGTLVAQPIAAPGRFATRWGQTSGAHGANRRGINSANEVLAACCMPARRIGDFCPAAISIPFQCDRMPTHPFRIGSGCAMFKCGGRHFIRRFLVESSAVFAKAACKDYSDQHFTCCQELRHVEIG
jgi:hypothetical protein